MDIPQFIIFTFIPTLGEMVESKEPIMLIPPMLTIPNFRGLDILYAVVYSIRRPTGVRISLNLTRDMQ